MSAAPTQISADTPAAEDRIAAIELLLQQIVLLLEAEPHVTAAQLVGWCAIASAAMRAHGTATEAQISALARLVQRVAA